VNNRQQYGDGPDDGNLQDAERYRRHRNAAFPTRASEVVPGLLWLRQSMPFLSWASANRFAYTEQAVGLFTHCGSAAEAFFLRPFTLRDGFAIEGDGIASAGGIRIQMQAPCFNFRIDFAVSDDRSKLAVEIDGMAFHHRTKEQVAADYLRQRRISVKGYSVIRYTAAEVFADAAACWSQIDAILAARRNA
jgi:very-short-patch-repair endonuclease